MKVIQCSVCQREAAWVIDGELFCERHKEDFVKCFGLWFEIERLTEIYGGGPILVESRPGLEGRMEMARIIEWQTTRTHSIPLETAMLCVNCNTISNSLPHRCSVCGSESVVRLISLLDPEPDPPAGGTLLPFIYTRAVAA